MIGVSEAMNLGVKLGMDAKKLAEVLSKSTARCWSVDTYNPVPGVMPNVPASRGWQGGFGVKLMAKDLGLANSAAQAQVLAGLTSREFLCPSARKPSRSTIRWVKLSTGTRILVQFMAICQRQQGSKAKFDAIDAPTAGGWCQNVSCSERS